MEQSISKTDYINTLDDINYILEKAQFIINKIEDQYGFAKSPDYNSIQQVIQNWHSINAKWTVEAEQTRNWMLGYDDVFTMVKIALDYVFEARQELIKAGATE